MLQLLGKKKEEEIIHLILGLNGEKNETKMKQISEFNENRELPRKDGSVSCR